MTFPATPKAHHTIIGRLDCVISGRPSPTLHHAQGPSIKARLAALGFEPSKSLSMRGSGEALILPLDAEYHTGKWGIDTGFGRGTWEETFGAQADLIDEVSSMVGYSLWDLHVLWYSRPLPKIFKRKS
jgi:hypothetical protein